MTPEAPAVDHAPRPWRAGAGLAPADAVTLLADAARFHTQLGDELDTVGRRGIGPDALLASATERRRVLQALLDRALDAAELLEGVARGCWP